MAYLTSASTDSGDSYESGTVPQRYSIPPRPSYRPTPRIFSFRLSVASMADPKSSYRRRLSSRMLKVRSLSVLLSRRLRSVMPRKMTTFTADRATKNNNAMPIDMRRVLILVNPCTSIILRDDLCEHVLTLESGERPQARKVREE